MHISRVNYVRYISVACLGIWSAVDIQTYLVNVQQVLVFTLVCLLLTIDSKQLKDKLVTFATVAIFLNLYSFFFLNFIGVILGEGDIIVVSALAFQFDRSRYLGFIRSFIFLDIVCVILIRAGVIYQLPLIPFISVLYLFNIYVNERDSKATSAYDHDQIIDKIRSSKINA